MKIRRAQKRDKKELVSLISKFRATLTKLRGIKAKINFAAAKKELAGYDKKNYPIFVAEDIKTNLAGYMVCKIDDKVVWAESLFVLPEYRCQRIGAALYAEAEQLAKKLGGNTVYNWVHPNNDKIILFLKKRGYDVLNLIEVRKAGPNEKPATKIKIGKHKFNY